MERLVGGVGGLGWGLRGREGRREE
jgi:hypothetical protein